MKKKIFTSSKSENLKSLFVVQYTMYADISKILTTSSEKEARATFEKEMANLKDTEPTVISKWADYDQAWSNVYQVELLECTIDEEGEIVDMETLEISNYYYL